MAADNAVHRRGEVRKEMPADSISTDELRQILTAGQPVTVVDIRSPTDREWSIPGSLQIDAYDAVKCGLGPLANLDFPPGPVVTVCGMGATAAKATSLLRASGVQAMTLEGGMRAWSLAWNCAQTTISGCEVVQVRRTGKGCLSYVIESQNEAVVIDASLDTEVYVQLLRDRGWRLVAVADTHIHADHLSRSILLAHQQGVDVWLPAQERAQYLFRSVADADRIAFGSTALAAWRTPGHTEESTTYLLDSTAAFTGDTLFLNSVGRPDLEGGTRQELASRARLLHMSVTRLLQLPEAAQVLPGHASEPIPFDGHVLATTVGTIRDSVALARLDSAAFVEAVLARIPPNPPTTPESSSSTSAGRYPAIPVSWRREPTAALSLRPIAD